MSSAKTRAGVAMKVTAIRVGPDLWRLLEREAARAGVSVSQYVREAALARAAAAANARGEDPLDLLAQAGDAASHAERSGEPVAPRAEDKPLFSSARQIRGEAQKTRSDAEAVRAQSRQASHHARQLARERKSDG